MAEISSYYRSTGLAGYVLYFNYQPGGFQVFVEVQVMTNKGGTNYSAATVVYYLYDKAFSNGQLGYGCALAVILAIIIFIITALNFAGQDRWVKTMD